METPCRAERIAPPRSTAHAEHHGGACKAMVFFVFFFSTRPLLYYYYYDIRVYRYVCREGLAGTNNGRDHHRHTAGLCRAASVWGHCASSTHTRTPKHSTDLSSRAGWEEGVTSTLARGPVSSSAVNRRTRSYKHTRAHFCRTTPLTDDDRVRYSNITQYFVNIIFSTSRTRK